MNDTHMHVWSISVQDVPVIQHHYNPFTFVNTQSTVGSVVGLWGKPFLLIYNDGSMFDISDCKGNARKT